jgi:murein DD-endopeptidase MepM/ murein hydrolase activator NlpD
LAIDGTHYVKPETFAIDWVRLQGGRQWTGAGAQNEQHFAFGADVVAVAEGTVVSVRDDMPEETPRQPLVAVQHVGDYAGNHVVVRLQPREQPFAFGDVWAIYAHLQPGSIPVRVGERVTTGQPLGRLGNTGNTSDPHLHFQLSDGPEPLASNSLPFVIDHYTLAGTVDPAAMVAAYTDPSAPREVRIEGTPLAQSGTHPLVLTVQDFR